MELDQFLFVGFNSRAAALDRESGAMIWEWKAKSGSGFVSLLLDGDRLFAAVNGHTYCLNPWTGEEIWHNPMAGFGYGVTSLASVWGSTNSAALAELSAQAAAAASDGGTAAAAAT